MKLTTKQRDMKENICTKEFPYASNNSLNGYWKHSDAIEVSERDIDYSTYE